MTVGSCKLCAFKKAKELNRRIKQGWNAVQVLEWTEPLGLTFDRKTFYKHRDEHAQHPADALVSYADHAVSLTEATVTPDQFADAIMQIGFQNAMADPSQVSINHSLKAASLLMAKKDPAQDLMKALIAVMHGARPADVVVIEGTAEEISPVA